MPEPHRHHPRHQERAHDGERAAVALQAHAADRQEPDQINQALGLAHRFRVGIRVEGYIGDNHHRINKMVHTLRKVEEPVYAHSVNWTDWAKVSEEQFHAIAMGIVQGR